MWRRVLRWSAPLGVLILHSLPAYAQSASESSKAPALQYTIAFLFTLLVLVILCTPSRKASRE